jgi:hypothetical protein
VPDDKALRDDSRKKGLVAGVSSGAALHAALAVGFETRDRGEDDRSAAGRYRQTVYHLCIIRGGCEYWSDAAQPSIAADRPQAAGG